MSEKRKSTFGAIKVKKWRKTIGIKDKSDVISRLEKGDRIAVLTFDSLTVLYVQVMIMLTE